MRTIDIYWWSKKKLENGETENFGDALVPYLLKKITDKNFIWVRPNYHKRFRLFKKKHYFMIGSILGMATTHSIVWGSGIIQKNAKVKKAKFLSVRGPHSRNRLIKLGYNVPEKYGDPALLLALFHKNNTVEKNFEYGIIPHYVDNSIVIKLLENKNKIKIINLLDDDPLNVINQILSCENIISSSLHGIIVSHAFGIPAMWAKFSNNLTGDDIKFMDYYHSVGMMDIKSIDFNENTLDDINGIFLKNKNICLPNRKVMNERIIDLIDSCPFPRSNQFNNRINEYFSENE